MNQKQMKLNLASTVMAFLISLGLNFYITPLISKEMGDAAYGFVGMANDFVSYASIISAVLNSVAARFVAVEIHRGNNDRANSYYSSVFIANIILAMIMTVAGIVFVSKLNSVFDIPASLQKETQITFLLTFANYVIVLISSVFTVCTYVTNRLDIAGIRNSVSYVLKFAVVILLVYFTQIHMYYLAIATIISSIFLAVTNVRLTKKLLPDLCLRISGFKTKYIKMLALSGIWMAISNLSQVLMTGLDSVITNKMLGAEQMGVLSISRTIPNAIILAISTLGVIFTPNFVQLYAKGKSVELVEACKQSIKVMGLVLGVPTIGVMIFGQSFYSLWLPYKTIDEIMIVQTLSVLMMMQSLFNLLTISIAQLSVVTNRLKTPVFVSLAIGVINVVVVIALIRFTDLGIFAVAGVSSILFSIRYLVFNPIYAAYVLKEKWYTFYGAIFKMIVPLVIVGVFYYFMAKNISISSWYTFIGTMIIAGAIGYFVVLVFSEYKKILSKLKKIKGKRNDSKN